MSSGASVIRPKSIATVVVVFRSTPVRSSTPTLSWVSSSSVRSGAISLTEATIVVLPAPKPPATSSFTAVTPTGAAARPAVVSEPANTIEHRLKYLVVRSPGRPEMDQLLLDQVTEQDLDHAERKLEIGR